MAGNMYIPPTQNPFLQQSMGLLQNIGLMYLGHQLKREDQERALEQQKQIRAEEAHTKMVMEGFTPVTNEQMMGDVGGGAPADQVNIYGKSFNVPKPTIVPITAGGVDTGQVGIKYRDKFTIVPKDSLEKLPDDVKKYIYGLKDPDYMARLNKEKGLDATADTRTFEEQFYGKLVPELRGTPSYKNDLLSWKGDKANTNPMVAMQAQQLEIAKRQEGNRLRVEFNSSPEVKTNTEITKQFGNIKQVMEENKSSDNKVASDQALIMTFNKMLDTLGTVRTEEYARTKNDLSFVNRLKGGLIKLVEGGPGLTDDDREAIFRMSERLKNVASEEYSKKYKEYRGYYSTVGLNPDSYLSPGDMKSSGEYDYIPGKGFVPKR